MRRRSVLQYSRSVPIVEEAKVKEEEKISLESNSDSMRTTRQHRASSSLMDNTASVELCRSLMLELLASLSPELSFDDIAEHMVRLTREFLNVDRVGFFLMDHERQSLLLKISHDVSGGVRIPLKGIAGHTAKTAKIVNLSDCYESDLFDPTMDMRTGICIHNDTLVLYLEHIIPHIYFAYI